MAVAAGQENVSAVQARYFDWVTAEKDPAVTGYAAYAYMPMIDTADVVARQFGISREAQDAFALQSQMRVAAAPRAAGGCDDVRGGRNGSGWPFRDSLTCHNQIRPSA